METLLPESMRQTLHEVLPWPLPHPDMGHQTHCSWRVKRGQHWAVPIQILGTQEPPTP